RQFATFVLHVVALRYHFLPEFVLAGEVRVLPETHAKALLLQISQHLCWIFKTACRKFEITAPVSFKPPGIEMDYVRRHAMGTKLSSNISYLLFGVVGN